MPRARPKIQDTRALSLEMAGSRYFIFAVDTSCPFAYAIENRVVPQTGVVVKHIILGILILTCGSFSAEASTSARKVGFVLFARGRGRAGGCDGRGSNRCGGRSDRGSLESGRRCGNAGQTLLFWRTTARFRGSNRAMAGGPTAMTNAGSR